MSKTLQGLNWSQLFSEHQTKEKSGEMSSHIPPIVFCLFSVMHLFGIQCFFPELSFKKKKPSEKWTPNLDL